MQASRVVISRETRNEMANNPLFKSRKAKSRFRAQKIIEYINSKPSGTKFGISELIAVAGYTESQYATGWAFVKRLQKSGILWIEKTNHFKKDVFVMKNADGSKVAKTKEMATDVISNAGTSSSIEIAPTVELPKEVDFREKVKTLAKDFSWNNNSDSLREFVNTL